MLEKITNVLAFRELINTLSIEVFNAERSLRRSVIVLNDGK